MKREVTPEMLAAYDRYLAGREAEARKIIATQEKHLARIQAKRAVPEKSLREELRDGTKGVYEMLGMPLTVRAKKQVKEQFQPIEFKPLAKIEEKPEEKPKSGWDW